MSLVATCSRQRRPLADAGLPDWETAYGGSNVDRLRRIKAKYDPDNIFQYEQSIPPATS